MDRSRHKRHYHGQDYDTKPLPRTKQRYNNNPHHRRTVDDGGHKQDPNLMVTTSFRILCHDLKAGGVIGKSGCIIQAIRQHTGAWISVHELTPGDDEKIIEVSDARRRDPDERMISFCPAREALLLVHERILESDSRGAGGYNVDEKDRVVTRLVVPKVHVGCLMGKGGKIIQQMQMETKTQIKVLPNDHNLPRCVAKSEEIVQIIGDRTSVKNALKIISSRLRDSQHGDHNYSHGRLQSPEWSFPPDDDDCIPHMNHPPRRTSTDRATFGSRLSASLTGARNNNYHSHQFAHLMESGPVFYGKDLVFRILCPVDKIDSVVRESGGIIELLQDEIGVDVEVVDPVIGSNEQIIIISSREGPADALFPAQEALLHIQTRIVNLVPDKENIITTRLLIPSGEIICLEGHDGSLSEIRTFTGANIEILPREELPVCVSGDNALLQIVGEIKEAREAIVEVTSRLRRNLYREFFQKDKPAHPTSTPSPLGSGLVMEATSRNNICPSQETYSGNDIPASSFQNVQTV